MTTHNPHMITHEPPAVATPQRPRKAKAGKWHRVQQAALQPQVITPDYGDDVRHELKHRAIAEMLMLLLFRFVWALNLAGTVITAVLIGRNLNLLLTSHGKTPLGDLDYALIAAGWQLFCTHVQQYLWRTGRSYDGAWQERLRAFWDDLDKTRLALVVVFGTLDSLPTAWLIIGVFGVLAAGSPWAIPLLTATIVSVTMAMVTEPMMTKHRRQMKAYFLELGQNERWF